MKTKLSKEQIKTIAREYNKEGATELAKKFGGSRQRIFQTVASLRKKGVIIPKIKDRYGKIDEAVRELRKESPELFTEGGGKNGN